MKIALYTIFRCTNYGAVLQAYALARVLRDILGEAAVDVINHRMDPRDNHLLGKITNPNTPWFQRWRNKHKFAARYFHPELFERRRAKTIRLIENFIRPTGKLYKNPKELRGLSPSGNGGLSPYDTVVVGSDQIWNPSLNHDFGHNQYLGTDLPDKQDRVAYAASFGVSELPEECRDEYRTALSNFRIITVREESGAKICKSLLSANGDSPQDVAKGDSPQVVLDPTLLLTADDWRMTVETVPDRSMGTVPTGGEGTVPKGREGTVPKGARGRYVAAYWVRTLTEADVAALARIARDAMAPVCLMSAGPLPKFQFPSEVAPYIDADPFDFVRTLSGATAVVTDSFHGLQFATLFKKPFLALGNISDPKSNASRLVDFCARYGLSGGIQDIAAFRSGTAHPFADVARFDAKAFEADRSRSRNALKGMLP